MHLSPRDIDKLLLHGAGFLAQKRLARGLRLGYPETVALLATQLLELIRDGRHPVAELVHEVQVEGTFEDGTKLVTVHDPIAFEDGDLSLALYGSFLPVPDAAAFAATPISAALPPGHIEIAQGAIDLYAGRDRITLSITSRGDRPIQVGSHYPFAATNSALDFDRAAAAGRHLDIPAGTAVRFEPGETRTVSLVANAQSMGAPTVSAGALARTFDRASGLLPDYDDEQTR